MDAWVADAPPVHNVTVGDASTDDVGAVDVDVDAPGVDSFPTDAPITDANPFDAATPDASLDDIEDVSSIHDATAVDVSVSDVPPPCATRITYGSSWMAPSGHPDAYDDVTGVVTWDGTCTDDGASSYAVLSNGWRPYFAGNGRCEIALDVTHCPGVTGACTTRYTYGPTWSAPAGHTAHDDDISGFATWDGVCHATATSSYAVLSNGWRPYFSGPTCAVSVRQSQCGEQYVNPLLGADCPDPGVLQDGSDYYLVCTSGDAADAFPIRRSRDLVHWQSLGAVFPSGHWPSWAVSDFWAPEIHHVGSGYVVYYAARSSAGQLAIGAATAASPAGPFTDLGAPLLYNASIGLIDPTLYTAPDGTSYLYWKDDGNAIGQPTPIHGQQLTPDGLSVTGPAPVLITNDLAWEGNVVEAPWVTAHGGTLYLLYSGNAYNTARYAVGVAQSNSPLGPFTKRGDPILVSNAAFAGPGHGSVVTSPTGASVWFYHAWRAGFVGGAGDIRQPMVDAITWTDGWPSLPGAPSSVALGYP